LRAKVEEADQLVPPVNGWQFWDYHDDKWSSDTTLECSRDLSEPCKEIVVELGGEAKKKLPLYEGSYLPVEGTIIRGRPLLKHASSNLYLRVSTDFTTTWAISDTIDEIGAMIVSGSSGGLCPACPSNAFSRRFGRTSWQWGDDVRWHNGDIVVTCVTHLW